MFHECKRSRVNAMSLICPLATSDTCLVERLATKSRSVVKRSSDVEQIVVEGFLRRADTLSGAFKIEAGTHRSNV